MSDFEKQFTEARNFLLKKLDGRPLPHLFIVLGSGFKDFVHTLNDTIKIDLNDIPNVPVPKVKGHGSELVVGQSGSCDVVVQSGRVHLYEGHSPSDVVFLLRVLASLGVEKVLLTNAAGGLNTSYDVGDIVLISDHINMTGENCLIGAGTPFEPRFINMNACYDPEIQKKMMTLSGLKQGVYMGVKGPNFETASECKAFRIMGADMVGMSTVLETICARQLSLSVTGLSFITNVAGSDVSHDEVLKMVDSKRKELSGKLKEMISLF